MKYALFLLAIIVGTAWWVSRIPSFPASQAKIPTEVPSLGREQPALLVGGDRIQLRITQTKEEHSRGLGGLTELHALEAMLFDFNTSDYHAIWMKDMQFPIDIIWLDETYSIVDIKEDARPENFPEIYFPNAPSLYVLETNAGFAHQYGLSAGDTLLIVR